MLSFLCGIRAFLRSSYSLSLLMALPSYLCSDTWGGEGWTEKLACAADGCLGLDSFRGTFLSSSVVSNVENFRGDPYMSLNFTSHHGFLKIYKLPSLQTLVPPSDRFSSLRGLYSSTASASTGGFGENNIAFRLTKRKLIFETLHLDIDDTSWLDLNGSI